MLSNVPSQNAFSSGESWAFSLKILLIFRPISRKNQKNSEQKLHRYILVKKIVLCESFLDSCVTLTKRLLQGNNDL